MSNDQAIPRTNDGGAAEPLALEKPNDVGEANFVTILNINGGGVCDIVPAMMLMFLETKLQLEQAQEASARGLMTIMLAAPNEQNRPLYAARYITRFYFQHSPRIFPKHGAQ
ncbi:acyl transferase/acyl hydrolase/lysophospholipase [Artemisia annua]|uniref:Acyl transferase/acyl hydrolase/lysophospholipase n=1 Tax=Artemisia annua TaxID=35608 RepID=A0A2U1N510_ARTAN|nr:acyl transferase/acyl hydrolase/lysophospholipase [Artemisia annua]